MVAPHLLCLVLLAGAEPPAPEDAASPPSSVEAEEDAQQDEEEEEEGDGDAPVAATDETPPGIEPLGWGAAAVTIGAATGLALTLPAGLAAAAWVTWGSVDFLLSGGRPSALDAARMVIYPVDGLIFYWMWAFAALGVHVAAMVAPPLVMLGAFYVNHIRLPWIPVVAAMIISHTLGCIAGSCVGFAGAALVGTVSGIIVGMDSARRGLTPAQRDEHPLLLLMSMMQACICPTSLLGGTLAGDVVGVMLLKPITDKWAARARSEDALPMDLLDARDAKAPVRLDDDE